MNWIRSIILALLLFLFATPPVYSITEPVQLSYPPLTSAPSDMAIDNNGYLWISLPSEKSVCRFDAASQSLRILNLPMMVTKIVKIGDKLMVYQRGSEKIFIIDPSSVKIETSVELPYPLENAWPSSRGFWAKFVGYYGLFLIDLDGTIIKEYQIEVVDYELALSEYGSVIWYINSDGKSVSRFDTATEVGESIQLEKFVYALIAVSQDKVWVVTSDGLLSLMSINSPTPVKTFRPKSGIIGINKLYLIDKDRVVFVNAASGVVGEIDGDSLIEQPLGENLPTLADMFKKSKLYFIDVKKNGFGFIVISNPPEIIAVSSTIKNDYELLIEANIKDREDDIREGYPYLKVMLGNKEVATIQMIRIDENKFVGSVNVSNMDGKISITLVAMDWGDNIVKSNIGTYSVKNGKIVTGEVTTTTTTIPSIETTTHTSELDIGQIMMLSLELVLLISLLAALVVIIRRRPRKMHRSKRLK